MLFSETRVKAITICTRQLWFTVGLLLTRRPLCSYYLSQNLNSCSMLGHYCVLWLLIELSYSTLVSLIISLTRRLSYGVYQKDGTTFELWIVGRTIYNKKKKILSTLLDKGKGSKALFLISKHVPCWISFNSSSNQDKNFGHLKQDQRQAAPSMFSNFLTLHWVIESKKNNAIF